MWSDGQPDPYITSSGAKYCASNCDIGDGPKILLNYTFSAVIFLEYPILVPAAIVTPLRTTTIPSLMTYDLDVVRNTAIFIYDGIFDVTVFADTHIHNTIVH